MKHTLLPWFMDDSAIPNNSHTVRNIFILSADSLRYDFYSACFPDLELDAVEFHNAIVAGSHTTTSVPTLHAGVYSDSDRLDGFSLPESDELLSLAEQLEAEGFSTGLWTPNQIFGEQYSFNRGFHHGDLGMTSNKKKMYNVLKNWGNGALLGPAKYIYFNLMKPILTSLGDREEVVWKSAGELHDSALSWLRESPDTNHLCWIHYMDTHHPFEPPQEYLDRYSLNNDLNRSQLSYLTREAIKRDGEGVSEEEIEDIVTAYRACCEYLGDEIKRFISALKEQGHFDPDRDLMCITADHGEGFSPDRHGLMGHFSFFEETVRVPLVISHPNWEKQSVEGQVSLIDLMPTILQLAGVDVPSTVAGSPAHTPEDMVREHAYMIDEDWYQTRRGIRSGDWKLFGLRNRDDEYELVLTRLGDVRSLEEEIVFRTTVESRDRPLDGETSEIWNTLQTRLEAEHGPLVEGEEITVSPDTEETLKDLGYM